MQLASSFLFLAACLAAAVGFGAMALANRIESPWGGKTRDPGEPGTQPTELDYVQFTCYRTKILRKGQNIFSHVFTCISHPTVCQRGFSQIFTWISHPVPFGLRSSTSFWAKNLGRFHYCNLYSGLRVSWLHIVSADALVQKTLCVSYNVNSPWCRHQESNLQTSTTALASISGFPPYCWSSSVAALADGADH